jgi:hypothetical protein
MYAGMRSVLAEARCGRAPSTGCRASAARRIRVGQEERPHAVAALQRVFQRSQSLKSPVSERAIARGAHSRYHTPGAPSRSPRLNPKNSYPRAKASSEPALSMMWRRAR